MAWTTPTTRITGELITAAIWNADVVDNLAYLLSKANDDATLSSDITTTSTSYVDMTGVTITMTLAGTQALVIFDARMQAYPGSNNARSFGIRLMEGANAVLERNYPGIAVTGEGSNSPANIAEVSFAHLVTGLTPGSNTFKLQWKLNEDGGGSGGTVKMYGTRGVQFVALEV